MAWNSIPGYSNPDPRDVHESLGLTKFSPTDESSWYQIIGGLIIQGGLLTASGATTFPAPYEKQVLGVFVNGGTATAVTLAGFTSSAANYWFAIGV